MFDIAWTEMLVIAVVLIVVVGPKELPGMLRTFGKTVTRLRAMANDFRRQFDDALKEAELDDLKKLADDARKLNPTANIKKALNPLETAGKHMRNEIESAFNPPKAEPPKPKPVQADETAGAVTPDAGGKAVAATEEVAAEPNAPKAPPASMIKARKAQAKVMARSAAKPAAKPATKPATKTPAKSEAKPVAETTAKPAAKPVTKSATRAKKKTGGAEQ